MCSLRLVSEESYPTAGERSLLVNVLLGSGIYGH